ncbi:DNA cytosine methyltransferase [Terriglobus sp. TAA 43]|uniref:DNA cytosine methyltransferase n=1 Tax=Terriglobus sp. TAA 43 TaxID=278961 RepID=UPI0018DC36B8|nr:DNA cytosine methyltransferase [Terriglobus sp. TAA 43]
MKIKSHTGSRLIGEKPSRSRRRITSHERRGALPQIVSLFCGAGGLDLGFVKAGFSIAVALDKSAAAVKTHSRNFSSESHCVDLRELGPKGVIALVERHIEPGARVGVIGGPPCQGFSRANTESHPNDPRNALVGLYLEIIHELKRKYRVDFIVFENVLGIQDSKHLVLYQGLLDEISKLKFNATAMRLCSLDFGVPQKRNRVVVAAVADGYGYGDIRVRRRKGLGTVREAIGNLDSPAFFSRSLTPQQIPVHPNHWTMRPVSKRFSTPPDTWRVGRSFKRTYWDKPSPTIAFGHREIHVHPSCKRRLSIYEALLLQGFPERFVLEGTFSAQVEQVSNAVPPPVAFAVATAIKHSVDGVSK